MMKKILFLILVLLVSLIGCQSNNLNLSQNISTIDVYEWGEDALVTSIEDNELIDELVEELNSANTASTANMDYPSPEYELIFKNDENEDVFKIGYYNEVMNLGVKGRYLDVNQDIMYQVDIKLPIY